MSRRSKVIIAAIVLLLLLLLGVLLFLRPQQAIEGFPEELGGPAANTNRVGLPSTNFSGGSFNANVSQPVNTAPPAPPAKPDERTNLKRIAAAFAERFGSFSNEGNFENIVDLKYFMTASLQTWADSYVADARSKPRSPEYSGTTTRSIAVEVSAFDEVAGTATVVVKTQRREQGSTAGSDSVYYQDLKLEFLKQGDTWKVDAATWLPR